MMGGELYQRMKLGVVTKTLASFILKICIKLITNLRFSFGEDPVPDGKYERAHVAFPLYQAMDRVVVTPEGETPPPLGRELPETNEQRNIRRSGKSAEIKFEVGPTYSFSFHSMYMDFARWKICNVPGYKTLDMKAFISTQSIYIVVYEINKNLSSAQAPHYVCDRKYYSTLELTHVSNMYADDETDVIPSDIIYDDSDGTPEDGISLRVNEMNKNDENSNNSIVRAHMPLLLTATPEPYELELSTDYNTYDESSGSRKVRFDIDNIQMANNVDKHTTSSIALSLAEDKGYAVRKHLQAHPAFQLIKLMRKNVEHGVVAERFVIDTFDANLSYGDYVQVQNMDTGKYLRIFRGWWLVWSDAAQSSRAVFCIAEAAENTRQKKEQRRIRSIPLREGTPFRLQSIISSGYEVGCLLSLPEYSSNESATLGLYKSSDRKPSKPAKWKIGAILTPLTLKAKNCSSFPTRVMPIHRKKIPRLRQLSKLIVPLRTPSALFHLSAPTTDQVLSFNAHIVGRVDLLSRTTGEACSAYFVSCSMLDREGKIQRWTRIRKAKDLSGPLAHLESRVVLQGLSLQRQHSLTSLQYNTSDTKGNDIKLHTSLRPSYCIEDDLSLRKFALRLSSLLDETNCLNKTNKDDDDDNNNTDLLFLSENNYKYSMEEKFKSYKKRSVLSSYSEDEKSSTWLPENSSTWSDPIISDDGSKEYKALCKELSDQVRFVLLSKLSEQCDLDQFWLSTDSILLSTNSGTKSAPTPIYSTVVGRAYWSTYWREEVLHLYSTHIVFYPTGIHVKKPALSLLIQNIISVSELQAHIDPRSLGSKEIPLPGMRTIRLETLGKVHYLVVPSISVRDELLSNILLQISVASTLSVDEQQSIMKSSNLLEDFAIIRNRWLPQGRIVLNSRRLGFDLQEKSQLNESDNFFCSLKTGEDLDWVFSAKLLRRVFNLDSSACKWTRNGYPLKGR